jgi:hypothetical protein
MKNIFSKWQKLIKGLGKKNLHPKKKKSVVVQHQDIDRWLKSVDDLAKDLKDLQLAKDKAKEKMKLIQNKFNEKDKKQDDKSGKNITGKADKMLQPDGGRTEQEPNKRKNSESERSVSDGKQQKNKKKENTE